MERSSVLPRGAIRPDDLVAVCAKPGPFATIWTELSGTGSYGESEDQRWRKNAVAGLAEAGAPEVVCAEVDAALGTIEPGVRGAVVIADESGSVLVEPLPEPPRRSLTRWAPLPSLSPVIEHRQASIPAVIVLADRLGADIVVTTPGHDDRVVEVQGADEPIRKTGQGGWSQSRYQKRAEDTWDQNARSVAERASALGDQSRAHVIIVGGDVRAVELIVDALPESQREITRTIEYGRAADSSGDLRDAEIDTIMRTLVATETVALLETFGGRARHHGTAATGLDDTVAAIRQAQVDVLLVHDDLDDERTVWVGTAPPHAVADAPNDLAVSGEPHIAETRVVDAAVSAVLQSGGSVRIVPDAALLDGGIGALLRWEAP